MASSLFCRHNRFTADCPICSKGTVLDPGRAASRRSSGPSASRTRAPGSARRKGARAAAPTSYPRAEVGPYDDAEGARYSVRLERVPGGLRLAEWEAGAMRKRAPRLAPGDLARLIEAAAEAGVLTAAEVEPLNAALPPPGTEPGAGASPARSGDLREELRLEPLEDGALRVARWMERPGTGWEVREAPVMLPPARYVEALVRAGAAAVSAS